MCKRCDNNPGFVKARFTGKAGSTAGLVLSHAEARHISVSHLSRYFPYGEHRKMEYVELSPVYKTWGEAFGHVF